MATLTREPRPDYRECRRCKALVNVQNDGLRLHLEQTHRLLGLLGEEVVASYRPAPDRLVAS